MCTAFLAPLQGAIHFPRLTGGGASLENAPLAPGYFPWRLRRESHLDGGKLMKMPVGSRHRRATSAQWHSHCLNHRGELGTRDLKGYILYNPPFYTRRCVMRDLNRRDLLKISGAAAAGAALPSFATYQSTARPAPASYPEILREPDSIVAFTDDQTLPLIRQGQRWNSGSIAVELKPRGAGAATEIAVAIEAPGVALQRVRLRWLARMPEGTRILGDQWERSYGDLEWRGLMPERVLPWYFLAAGARAAHAYGVRTGAAAFCFWQADASGISMWLDVRNGGAGVDFGVPASGCCGDSFAPWRRRRNALSSGAVVLPRVVRSAAAACRSSVRRQ